MSAKHSNTTLNIIIAIVIISFIGIFILNSRIQKQIESIEDRAQKQPKKVIVEVTKPEKKKRKRKIDQKGVIREERLDPNRKFSQSIVYVDGEEVARFKESKRTIIDSSGKIPDGRVRFYNLTTNTYGEEYFRNGKRIGEFKEYYKDGRIKREVRYESGKVIKNKEYYVDETLRLEEDCRSELCSLDFYHVISCPFVKLCCLHPPDSWP